MHRRRPAPARRCRLTTVPPCTGSFSEACGSPVLATSIATGTVQPPSGLALKQSYASSISTCDNAHSKKPKHARAKSAKRKSTRKKGLWTLAVTSQCRICSLLQNASCMNSVMIRVTVSHG